MSDVTEKLSLFQKFINSLSWWKLFLLISFLAVIMFSVAIFENRTEFYKMLRLYHFSQSPPQNYKVSKASSEEINKAVIQSELIVGMQITVVDFNRNVRLIIYTSIDDDKLKLAYQSFLQKSISEVPLFNSDSVNNVKMSQLINGEFVCTPYKDTIAYKLFPEGAEYVVYVCANGIPPYYGKFTGIVTLYLKRMPTVSELDQLRTLSKSISLSVFERDLK